MRDVRPHPYDADAILRKMIADTESDWPQRILDSMWRVGMTEHDVSPAEIAALNAISHGLTLGMAAELMVKERETVKSQLRAVRLKLKAKNTTHAACIAIRKGLIQ